jgi:streptogramin lyase
MPIYHSYFSKKNQQILMALLICWLFSSIELKFSSAIQFSNTKTDGISVPQAAGNAPFTLINTYNSTNTFHMPAGIAVNASGYVFICDALNNRIQVFSPSGQLVTKWGQNGGDGSSGYENGSFHYPCGIAINSTGYVYIADSGNYRIQVFSPNGQFLFKIGRTDGNTGTGNGEFSQVEGIAINSTNYVYVADTFNNRIQVFAPDGTFLYKWGSGGGNGSSGSNNGEFYYPEGLTINGTGHVYATDSENNRVQVFTSTGQYLFNMTGFTGYPKGIAFNSTGQIFVTDYSADLIRVFEPNGTYLYSWGGSGQIQGPWGITFASINRVIISEYQDNYVRMYSTGSSNSESTGPSESTSTSSTSSTSGTSSSPSNSLVPVISVWIIYLIIAITVVVVIVIVIIILKKPKKSEPQTESKADLEK